MRIADLPKLSTADLAENDVVAVDHDTGNGIETRRFRVGQALANKLDKTGDALNVDVLNGNSRIYAKPNENRDGYFPLSSIQKMDISASFANPRTGKMEMYYTIPEGYTILNITLETVGWVGAIYATEIKNTSCDLYCSAVGWDDPEMELHAIVAHISMYKTFG